MLKSNGAVAQVKSWKFYVFFIYGALRSEGTTKFIGSHNYTVFQNRIRIKKSPPRPALDVRREELVDHTKISMEMKTSNMYYTNYLSFVLDKDI